MKQKEEMVVLEVQGHPEWMKDTYQNGKALKRIINASKEDIIRHVDGFYYYYPLGSENQGIMTAFHLKVIAWYIDKLNEPYEKQIEEYFEKEMNEQTKEKLDF